MIKIGVADYGMNVWYGGIYDYRERLKDLKEIGYDGIERLSVSEPGEILETMADAKKMGMDFGTCNTGTAKNNLRYTSALGMTYIWTDPAYKEMDLFCRQVNEQIKAASKYGLKVVLHNHLGIVEKQEEVEEFLEKCPDACLLLDTAHLVGAGGDPIEIIEKYFDRIHAVHIKDYVYKDKNAVEWYNRLRFCELGAGELKETNKKVLALLQEKGYEGWIFVEHDTHLQDPLKDLAISREYIRNCGI